MAARDTQPRSAHLGDNDGVDIRRARTEPPEPDFPVQRLPLQPPAITPIPELVARPRPPAPAVTARGSQRGILRLNAPMAPPTAIELPRRRAAPPLPEPPARVAPGFRPVLVVPAEVDAFERIRSVPMTAAANNLSLRPDGYRWRIAAMVLIVASGVIAAVIGFSSNDDLLNVAHTAEPAPVAARAPVAPAPVAPVPSAPAPVAPVPSAPAPVAPVPVAPVPVAPVPSAPAPVAPAPVAPAPVAPVPSALVEPLPVATRTTAPERAPVVAAAIPPAGDDDAADAGVVVDGPSAAELDDHAANDSVATRSRPRRRKRRPSKSERRARAARARDSARRRASARAAAAARVAERAAAAEPGYLTIDANPYCTIYVDGALVGDTPIVRYELPAGRYRIRAVPSDGSKPSRFRIDIKSGRTVRRKLAGDD